MIETVKVSDKARQQLINIKKRTGIQNWNVICRWAFTASLAENSKVLDENIIANSAVEMTWKTFTGGHEKLYIALLLTKAKKIIGQLILNRLILILSFIYIAEFLI